MVSSRNPNRKIEGTVRRTLRSTYYYSTECRGRRASHFGINGLFASVERKKERKGTNDGWNSEEGRIPPTLRPSAPPFKKSFAKFRFYAPLSSLFDSVLAFWLGKDAATLDEAALHCAPLCCVLEACRFLSLFVDARKFPHFVLSAAVFRGRPGAILGGTAEAGFRIIQIA